MKDLAVLNGLQGRIEWDADGAKSAITSVVAPYRDLVVTDDNVKDMEKAQKELASMRRKIDKFRKDTKKSAEEPIKAFEMEVYAILKIVDDAEAPLKDQLHKYEVDRVNAVSASIMEEANKEATVQGLREQYMFDFKIDSSWTNRTAKKSEVLSGITSKIAELKSKQDLDDGHAMLVEANKQQIILLCENLSAKYSLNTPVTPSDCPANLADTSMPADLVVAIESIVKRAADRELVAAQAAEAMAAAKQQEIEQPVREKPVVANTETSELLSVTIVLKHVSPDQMEMLNTHKKIGGMEYEIIDKVGE